MTAQIAGQLFKKIWPPCGFAMHGTLQILRQSYIAINRFAIKENINAQQIFRPAFLTQDDIASRQPESDRHHFASLDMTLPKQ